MRFLVPHPKDTRAAGTTAALVAQYTDDMFVYTPI